MEIDLKEDLLLIERELIRDQKGKAIPQELKGVRRRLEDPLEAHTSLQEAQGLQAHIKVTALGDQAVLHLVQGVEVVLQGQEAILHLEVVEVAALQGQVIVNRVLPDQVQAQVQGAVQVEVHSKEDRNNLFS